MYLEMIIKLVSGYHQLTPKEKEFIKPYHINLLRVFIMSENLIGVKNLLGIFKYSNFEKIKITEVFMQCSNSFIRQLLQETCIAEILDKEKLLGKRHDSLHYKPPALDAETYLLAYEKVKSSSLSVNHLMAALANTPANTQLKALQDLTDKLPVNISLNISFVASDLAREGLNYLNKRCENYSEYLSILTKSIAYNHHDYIKWLANDKGAISQKESSEILGLEYVIGKKENTDTKIINCQMTEFIQAIEARNYFLVSLLPTEWYKFSLGINDENKLKEVYTRLKIFPEDLNVEAIDFRYVEFAICVLHTCKGDIKMLDLLSKNDFFPTNISEKPQFLSNVVKEASNLKRHDIVIYLIDRINATIFQDIKDGLAFVPTKLSKHMPQELALVSAYILHLPLSGLYTPHKWGQFIKQNDYTFEACLFIRNAPLIEAAIRRDYPERDLTDFTINELEEIIAKQFANYSNNQSFIYAAIKVGINEEDFSSMAIAEAKIPKKQELFPEIKVESGDYYLTKSSTNDPLFLSDLIMQNILDYKGNQYAGCEIINNPNMAEYKFYRKTTITGFPSEEVGKIRVYLTVEGNILINGNPKKETYDLMIELGQKLMNFLGVNRVLINESDICFDKSLPLLIDKEHPITKEKHYDNIANQYLLTGKFISKVGVLVPSVASNSLDK